MKIQLKVFSSGLYILEKWDRFAKRQQGLHGGIQLF